MTSIHPEYDKEGKKVEKQINDTPQVNKELKKDENGGENGGVKGDQTEDTKKAEKDDKLYGKESDKKDAKKDEEKAVGQVVYSRRSFPLTKYRMPDPEKVYDVTIIGAGPAGCMLACCLSRLGIKPLLIDAEESEDHQWGRGDGLHARAIEVLAQIGTAGPDGNLDKSIAVRSALSNARSMYDSQGALVERRHMVEVNDVDRRYGCFVRQGLVEEVLLRDLVNAHSGMLNNIVRPCTFTELQYDVGQDAAMPIRVEITDKHSKQHTFHTRFLVGADGGKSAVRKSLASFGVTFDGTAPEALFCVIDLLGAKTTLPDKRAIVAYESEHGSVLYIPREPIKKMDCFRMYIEVLQDVGLTRDQLTEEYAIAAARKILHPYTLDDWKEVNWFSTYADGRFLASAFDVDNRIFLAGDACHTHSPKAGQGMNTSMMDAHNLSWKLALVLKGLVASPQAVLSTYGQERRPVALDLLEFDKAVSNAYRRSNDGGFDERGKSKAAITESLSQLFERYEGFQSGLDIRYEPNSLIASRDAQSPARVQVGARLPPATVRRYGDMLEVAILDELPFDLRFRVIVLIGDLTCDANRSALLTLSDALSAPTSFAVRLHHADIQTKSYDPVTGIRISRSVSLFDFKTVTSASATDPLLVSTVQAHDTTLLHSEALYCDDVAAVSPLEYLVRNNKWTPPKPGQKPARPPLEVLHTPMHQKYDVDAHKGAAIIVVRPDGYVSVVEMFDVADMTEATALQVWQPVQQYFEGVIAPTST